MGMQYLCEDYLFTWCAYSVPHVFDDLQVLGKKWGASTFTTERRGTPTRLYRACRLEDNKVLPSVENINLNPAQPQPTYNTEQHKHGARGKHQIVRVISRMVIGCLQVWV